MKRKFLVRNNKEIVCEVFVPIICNKNEEVINTNLPENVSIDDLGIINGEIYETSKAGGY